MKESAESFNRELNIVALKVLEKQMMVRDMRKALEEANNDLVKLLQKAEKIRNSFRDYLDANPNEKLKFMGEKRMAEVAEQEKAQEAPTPSQEAPQEAAPVPVEPPSA